MKVATWNIQGSSKGGQNLWTADIPKLLFGPTGADVVCVQEAGLIPDSYDLTTGRGVPRFETGLPRSLAGKLKYYEFQPTPRVKKMYVLWLNTDPAGHRVNVAICSKVKPTSLLLARSGIVKRNGKSSRPAIGMNIGNTAVYSLHAWSGGGGDAKGLLQRIRAANSGRRRRKWAALGDYNRDPATLSRPPAIADTICPPNAATQKSGGKLDYAVISAAGPVTGQVQGTGGKSDHDTVVYDGL